MSFQEFAYFMKYQGNVQLESFLNEQGMKEMKLLQKWNFLPSPSFETSKWLFFKRIGFRSLTWPNV